MYKFLFILFIFSFPFFSHSQVEITEIMYDVDGTDAGYEWIEIHNISGDSIEITEWYFFENETYHGLHAEGFTLLEEGERALIVQNIYNIESLYGNSIKLIKSSFGLNNSGESLAVYDKDKILVTEIEYTSESGAAGDGNSLQIDSNNSWIAANPTPGTRNTELLTIGDENTESNNTKESSLKAKKEKNIENYYTGYININSQLIAREAIDISAYVIHSKKGKDIKKLKGGSYYVNFGDGSFFESDERIETSHIYEYPGSYIISFEYIKHDWHEEIKNNPPLIVYKKVEISEPDIAIKKIDNRLSVVLVNNISLDVDIAGWHLVSGDQKYTFPKYSYIESMSQITVPRNIHSLSSIYGDNWITLVNSENITISSYTSNAQKMKKANPSDSSNNNVPIKSIESVNFDQEDVLIDTVPKKDIVYFDHELQSASVLSTSAAGKNIPHVPIVATGFIALLLVSLRYFYKIRESKEIPEEFEDVIGEIELLE